MSLDVGFASQTPALPTGAGSLSGLGETFTPDLSTGTGTLSVPLDLPNGPNDIAPKLALRYDTASPNGPFGLGWTIALPRILRSTMRGVPVYDDGDTLVLEGSGPLVRLDSGRLCPQVDTGEWRIEAAGDGSLVTDRAGTRYRLGTTEESRIPGIGGTWAWLLHDIEDNLGNIATFTWRTTDAQRYLAQIDYGPFRLSFGYEGRPDRLRFGRGGFELHTEERCSSIELQLPADAVPLVRRWELRYTQSVPSGASLLERITLSGFGADGTQLSAPPLVLAYQEPGEVELRRIPAVDESFQPPGLDGGGRVELCDFSGDGLADLIEIGRDGSARVWPNLGGRFGRPQAIGDLPQLAQPGSRAALVDLSGDGRSDVVRVDQPLAGYQPLGEQGVGRPVRWQQAPSVTLLSAAVRLADFDGDGIADVLWSTETSLLLAQRADDPDGWEARPTVVSAAGAQDPPTNLADPHVFAADMTGDGTPDLVRVDGGGVTYWSYLGYGRFSPPVRPAAPPQLPSDVDPRRLFVVDLDGDGCADVLHVDDGAVTWWPNCSGASFGSPRRVNHLPTGAMTEVRVADLLGVGTPALCWSTPLPSGRAAWFALDLLGGVQPGLLRSFDTSVGRSLAMSYSTSAREARRDSDAGAPWRSRLPVNLPVLAAVTARDAVSGRTDVTRYEYHEGRFDGVLREFCGFGRVVEESVGDDHVPTLCTTRWFSTGTTPTGDEPASTDERRRLRAIRGRAVRQERATADGKRFDRIDYVWRVDDTADAGVLRPWLARSMVSQFEGADAPASWIVTEQVALDGDGNVLESLERAYQAGTATPVSALRTGYAYATDPAGRFRQRPVRVTQQNGAGAIIADMVVEYDERPFGEVGSQGLVTARWALAIRDDTVREAYGVDVPDSAALGYVRRAGSDGWWVQQARYARTDDAGGLRGTITGARGGTTQLTFDETRCYPVRVVDAMGNTLTADFDNRVYRPTRLVDASGAVSTATFDALARPVAVVHPPDSDAAPTVAYAYRADVVPVEVSVTTKAGPGEPAGVTRELLDGEGRVLERRALDDAGEVIEASHQYGARGLLVRSYLPARATSASYARPGVDAPHAEVFYDAIGRPLSTVRPDGATRSMRYLPGRVEIVDERGALSVRTLAPSGRAVKVELFDGASSIASTYELDVKGQLLRQTDAAGSVTTFTYDALNRLVCAVRPEAALATVYDPAGNIVESRAGAHRVFRSFDEESRLTDVRHGTPAAAPVVRCTYHDVGAPAPPDAGIHTAGGRLVRVDDEAGVTVLDYDERGRLCEKRVTPSGGTPLRLQLTHRSDGRIDSITAGVAGAEPVARYRYDRRGRLVAIDGYVDEIAYDVFNQRVSTRYANGVVTSEERDPLSGWRTRLQVTGPAGPLRDQRYSFDPTGNVTAIASPDPKLAWTYEYDAYERLTGANGSDGSWAYTYDQSTNLLSSSDVGTYAYGGAGAPPTCLTQAGTGAFTYDDRGHVQTAPWGTHQVDEEGRLRRMDLAAGGRHEFTYAHTGRLARRVTVDAAGTTREVLTPDQLIAVEDGVVVFQITDGTRIVAQQRGDAKAWLHYDHLGSLVMATDSAGDVVTSIRYGPYGTVLEQTGSDRGHGFATGDPAAPQLVLLGQRWYSPAIGRFLSPDPLVGDGYDPLAWNAYAYCRANPASAVDPTGQNGWKILGMVIAAIAIIVLIVVVSVVTYGAATPGAIAAGAATWGAVTVGFIAGGIIGGIAAARARGRDAGDIFLGVLVGGAVGGWAALGAVYAGAAVSGAAFAAGLSNTVGGAIAGGVGGAINGAAMGFAAGFAGGRFKDFGSLMGQVLVGTVVGLGAGAFFGYLGGVRQVYETAKEALINANLATQPAAPPIGPPLTTPAPVNDLGAALQTTGIGLAIKNLIAVAPHIAPVFRSVALYTVVVDAAGGAIAANWDDVHEWAKKNNISFSIPFPI